MQARAAAATSKPRALAVGAGSTIAGRALERLAARASGGRAEGEGPAGDAAGQMLERRRAEIRPLAATRPERGPARGMHRRCAARRGRRQRSSASGRAMSAP
jgi:hypothetical protein